MTEQELAAIEREHPAPCYCSIPWPCDVAKLAAEVRRLRAGLRDLVEATMDDGNTPAATRAHLRAQALLD